MEIVFLLVNFKTHLIMANIETVVEKRNVHSIDTGCRPSYRVMEIVKATKDLRRLILTADIHSIIYKAILEPRSANGARLPFPLTLRHTGDARRM